MNMESWKNIYISYLIFATIVGVCFGSNEKRLLREHYEKSSYIKNTTERSARTVSRKVSSLFINLCYLPLNTEVHKFTFHSDTLYQISIRRATHSAANIFVFQTYTAQRRCQESNIVRKVYQ